MSEWTRYKLKDISSLSNGINFDKSAYTSGVKLIGVSDFKDRVYPDYDSLQEVDPKVVRSGDYLEKGDIVFVRSNGNKELVGRCMMIDRDIPVTFSGFCIKLRLNNKNRFEPIYFNYLFRSRQFRKSMAGTAVGANIQNLSQSRLGNSEVYIPDVEIQKAIASIISRYDFLILNYQQQIKLMEEAAQRLYKEWFVDLHFPGYENTEFLDGVPDGWERKKIGDLISKTQRTKQVPTNCYQSVGRIPIIDQSKNYIAGYTDDEECKVSVEIPFIVFGDHTRVLKYIPFSFAKGAYGTQLIMTNDLKRMPQSLFYNSLKHVDLSNYSYARHFKYLKEEQILVPTELIADRFDSFASKWYKAIQQCRKEINILTEARDRLLPKLMSGEISVETAQSVTSGLGVRKEQTVSPQATDS